MFSIRVDTIVSTYTCRVAAVTGYRYKHPHHLGEGSMNDIKKELKLSFPSRLTNFVNNV